VRERMRLGLLVGDRRTWASLFATWPRVEREGLRAGKAGREGTGTGTGTGRLGGEGGRGRKGGRRERAPLLFPERDAASPPRDCDRCRHAAERPSDNYRPAGSPGNPVNDRRAMVAIIIDYEAGEVRAKTTLRDGSVACVLPLEKCIIARPNRFRARISNASDDVKAELRTQLLQQHAKTRGRPV